MDYRECGIRAVDCSGWRLRYQLAWRDAVSCGARSEAGSDDAAGKC